MQFTRLFILLSELFLYLSTQVFARPPTQLYFCVHWLSLNIDVLGRLFALHWNFITTCLHCTSRETVFLMLLHCA